MKQSIILLAMLLSSQAVHSQFDEPPAIDRAHNVVDYLVDTVERVPGVIVASKVTGAKWRFDSKGVNEYASAKKVDEDTIFEIGSVTKVFTAVLLADMVQRGEVRLDESILDYLPAASWPEPIGHITFLHLATHTSGLPRRPDNLKPEDGRGPYADYDETDLLKYLETVELVFMPGESASYSNLGVGLLGVLLADAAGTSLEELLRSRIFEPLGMVSTTIQTLAHHNIATPHDITGSETTGFWSFDALAGAGGIRSTARDMARFVDSLLGLRESSIALASQSTLNELHTIPGGDLEYYLAWNKPDVIDDHTVFSHDGGTGGSRSMIALEPQSRSATIVLGNAASNLTGFGLYVHLPGQEMPSLEKLREIVLSSDRLALMIGEYALSEAESIRISMRNEQLYSEIGSDGAYPVFPYGSDRLFYRIGEARLVFEFQNIGKAATAVTLITPNGHSTGVRMESSK